MLTDKQKGRLARDREFEAEKDDHHIPKVKIGVGDKIEFKNMPEFNGTVYKISSDVWKLIYIDYGKPGHSKVIPPAEMKLLIESGLAHVIPAPVPEKAKKTLKKMQEELSNGS